MLRCTYSLQVVELISKAIGDQMEAEFTGLRDRDGHAIMPPEGATVDDWKTQTFYATGAFRCSKNNY